MVKFIETIKCNNKKILTPIGEVPILYIHKTAKLKKYAIKLENGLELICAENHVIIDKDFNEVFSKDSLNKIIQTVKGNSKVVSVTDLNELDNFYDLELEGYHLYYSNGILSHNSGKSISTSIYLTWLFLFRVNLTIGICANKGKLAAEFLNNVKNIFLSIPIWMQQGITIWNKGSIENENGTRILTDVPSSDSFRGFTCLEGSSKIEVYDKVDKQYKKISIKELYDKL